MCLFHVKLDFISLERKITTAMMIHGFYVIYRHLLVVFSPRALAFSNGLCSIHNNTILISSSTLKKFCFIYVFNLFLLLIHIKTLDALHKFLTMTNCTPEYYDFIMGRTKHKEQITERFMLHATISTIYR